MAFLLSIAARVVVKVGVRVVVGAARAGLGAARAGGRAATRSSGPKAGISITLDHRFPQVKRDMHNAIEAALNTAADTALRSARRRVPRDTGELRDSIHRTPVERSRRGGLQVRIATGDVPYARFVEYGSVRGAAQPFIRPAARSGRTKFRREVRAEIKRRLPGS